MLLFLALELEPERIGYTGEGVTFIRGNDGRGIPFRTSEVQELAARLRVPFAA
jgi:hypothetical protein